MSRRIVRVSDRDLVQYSLDVAQWQARVRLLTSSDVVAATREAEAMLDEMGVRQADRLGSVIEVSSSGRKPFPAAYRGVPYATFIRVRRARDGWRLDGDAVRAINRSGSGHRWLFTTLPSDEALLHAAQVKLRRGTDGHGRASSFTRD